jgi:hypothetical protein
MAECVGSKFAVAFSSGGVVLSEVALVEAAVVKVGGGQVVARSAYV